MCTRNIVSVVLLSWFSVFPLTAQGPIPDVNDGNALQRECGEALNQADNAGAGSIGTREEVERGSDMGQCLGLVTGVWHTHMMMVDDFGSREAFCANEIVSAGRMARIVDAYLKRYPGELKMWDTVLILRAFIREFPCN